MANGADVIGDGEEDPDLALALKMSLMQKEAPVPTDGQAAGAEDEEEDEDAMIAKVMRESLALEEEAKRRAQEEERLLLEAYQQSLVEAGKPPPVPKKQSPMPATTPSPSYKSDSPARPSAPSPLVLPAAPSPAPQQPSPARLPSPAPARLPSPAPVRLPSPAPLVYSTPTASVYANHVVDDRDDVVEDLLRQTAMEYQQQRMHHGADDIADVLEESRKVFEMERGRDLTREEAELRRAQEESRRDEERRRAMAQMQQEAANPARRSGPAWGAREWVEEINVVGRSQRKALAVLRGDLDNQLERFRVERKVEVTIAEDGSKITLRACRSRLGAELLGSHMSIEEMDNVLRILRAEVEQTLVRPETVIMERSGHNLHVFIDWSNIVLGARHAGPHRVDPARFISLITADRAVKTRFVAGSEGLAYADQWPIFESLGWPRYKEDGGKELAVDMSIQLKIYDLVLRNFEGRQKIILCTGDGNFKDESGRVDQGRVSFPEVVQRALQHGFMVEVYSWSWATSQNFRTLTSDSDYRTRLKLTYLDNYRSYLCKGLDEQLEHAATSTGSRSGSASPALGSGRQGRPGRSPSFGSSSPARGPSSAMPAVPAFQLQPPPPLPEPQPVASSTPTFSMPAPPPSQAMAQPDLFQRPIGSQGRSADMGNPTAMFTAFSNSSTSTTTSSSWSTKKLDARSASFSVGSRVVGGGAAEPPPSFRATDGMMPLPAPPGFMPPSSAVGYGARSPYVGPISSAGPYASANINGMTVMGTPGFMPPTSMVGGGAFYSSGHTGYQAGLTMPPAPPAVTGGLTMPPAPPAVMPQPPPRPNLYAMADTRDASAAPSPRPPPPGLDPARPPQPAPTQPVVVPPPATTSAAPVPPTAPATELPKTANPMNWTWDGLER